MKKIKFFMLAAMAMLVSASFTACSSDSDDTTNNQQKYQDIVRQTVHDQKKNDKALLLVAFGSTWQVAFDDFDATVKAYKEEFPGYDVYISFSSAICRNRAAAGEHKDDPENPAQVRNYYAPERWLNAFGQEKYADITVQSLQVIPGEEYGRVVNALKDFANNGNNDLDNNYLKTVKLHLGTPLMATGSDDVTQDNDVKKLAVELDKIYGTKAKEGAMLFMGHGNPDEYDTYSANVRYTQLEKVLQTMNKSYFVGTVDMMENFKTNVKDRMEAASITTGKVFCAPLMSIAGDHAHNDMAGDDDGWIENEETGEYEETSWKIYFADTRGGGYTCIDETMIVKGLLYYPAIRQLWINHTKEAQKVDLEWYHSNDGTE